MAQTSAARVVADTLICKFHYRKSSHVLPCYPPPPSFTFAPDRQTMRVEDVIDDSWRGLSRCLLLRSVIG